MRSKIKLLFSLFVLTPLCARAAAPVINSVSGTLSEGQSISIDVTGPGNGPHIVLFDDLEGGTTGAAIATGPGSATVGQWSSVSTNAPVYSTETAVSGTRSMFSDMGLHWLVYASANLVQSTQVLVCTSYRIDGVWAGYGNPSKINDKDIWLMRTTTGLDDLFFAYNSTWTFGAPIQNIIDGNNMPYVKYALWQTSTGTWHQICLQVFAGSAADGTVRLWDMAPSGWTRRLNLTGQTVSNPGQYWDQVHINGYGRQTVGCRKYHDDVYITSGPYAMARVEIGNAPVYTSCTRLARLTPTNWNPAGTIAATMRLGEFSQTPTDMAWLYVINSDDEYSAGFPVLLGSSGGGGGGGSDTAPGRVRFVIE